MVCANNLGFDKRTAKRRANETCYLSGHAYIAYTSRGIIILECG